MGLNERLNPTELELLWPGVPGEVEARVPLSAEEALVVTGEGVSVVSRLAEVTEEFVDTGDVLEVTAEPVALFVEAYDAMLMLAEPEDEPLKDEPAGVN